MVWIGILCWSIGFFLFVRATVVPLDLHQIPEHCSNTFDNFKTPLKNGPTRQYYYTIPPLELEQKVVSFTNFIEPLHKSSQCFQKVQRLFCYSLYPQYTLETTPRPLELCDSLFLGVHQTCGARFFEKVFNEFQNILGIDYPNDDWPSVWCSGGTKYAILVSGVMPRKPFKAQGTTEDMFISNGVSGVHRFLQETGWSFKNIITFLPDGISESYETNFHPRFYRPATTFTGAEVTPESFKGFLLHLQEDHKYFTMDDTILLFMSSHGSPPRIVPLTSLPLVNTRFALDGARKRCGIEQDCLVRSMSSRSFREIIENMRFGKMLVLASMCYARSFFVPSRDNRRVVIHEPVNEMSRIMWNRNVAVMTSSWGNEESYSTFFGDSILQSVANHKYPEKTLEDVFHEVVMRTRTLTQSTIRRLRQNTLKYVESIKAREVADKLLKDSPISWETLFEQYSIFELEAGVYELFVTIETLMDSAASENYSPEFLEHLQGFGTLCISDNSLYIPQLIQMRLQIPLEFAMVIKIHLPALGEHPLVSMDIAEHAKLLQDASLVGPDLIAPAHMRRLKIGSFFLPFDNYEEIIDFSNLL